MQKPFRWPSKAPKVDFGAILVAKRDFKIDQKSIRKGIQNGTRFWMRFGAGGVHFGERAGGMRGAGWEDYRRVSKDGIFQ